MRLFKTPLLKKAGSGNETIQDLDSVKLVVFSLSFPKSKRLTVLYMGYKIV